MRGSRLVSGLTCVGPRRRDEVGDCCLSEARRLLKQREGYEERERISQRRHSKASETRARGERRCEWRPSRCVCGVQWAPLLVSVSQSVGKEIARSRAPRRTATSGEVKLKRTMILVSKKVPVVDFRLPQNSYKIYSYSYGCGVRALSPPQFTQGVTLIFNSTCY